MKKFVTTITLLLTGVFVFAQVQSQNFTMSQGSNTALEVYLKKTNKKEVEDAWSKFIKKFKGKTKSNKKAGELFTDDAMIKKMSSNTVDIYASVIEKGEDTDLRVWFDLGGAYLSPATHPERYPAGVELLEEFKLLVSKAAMEAELKDQEGLLKKMVADLESLKKEEANQEADIVKYEQKIEQARKKISEAQSAQKTKAGEIGEQERVLKDLMGKLSALK